MHLCHLSILTIDTSPLQERYLLSIAYATHPSEKLMKDLLGLLKKERDNEKLKQSISLAAASVLNTYCRDQDKCKTKAAQNMKNTILDKLKNCKEDPCTLMYIRALGNAGLVETLPLLIDTAENSKSFAISYAAVNSMRRIDKKHITPEIEKTLKRIFNQNKRNYDTTVRAEALQLLLTLKPTTHFLRNVILTASDQTEHEFSTYIVAAINDVMKTDAQIRAQVLSILKDPKLYHYGLMAQRGDSTLIKGFMTKTTDNHVMYAISVQSAKSGVMRRSSLQVTSFGDHQILPITTFHIFAQGLESLTGKADEEGGEEQEVLDPSAGMQLDMLDVSLPPVTFFTGSGELMSAVWNAPTEPVTALQATIMLHDRVHRIHLQNGLIVELNIQGVVSMDLSGAISISLWNRYAKSVITNSGALTIKGTTTIATPMFTTESNYHLSGASQIDFRSDVNFYESPFKACLDMSHPPFILKHSFTKYEYLKGTKKSYKSTVNRNRTVHPQSFLIHPKVSAMCRELITDEE